MSLAKNSEMFLKISNQLLISKILQIKI